MDNCNVCSWGNFSSKCHILKIWQIARNVTCIGLYFPGLHAFSKLWLKLNENCGSNSLLKILTYDGSEYFAKCTEWPQTELKESDTKCTLHMQYTGPQVPNFCPFRSTISCFQDIAHFRISNWPGFPSPYGPVLTKIDIKWQSDIKFLKFGRSPKK